MVRVLPAIRGQNRTRDGWVGSAITTSDFSQIFYAAGWHDWSWDGGLMVQLSRSQISYNYFRLQILTTKVTNPKQAHFNCYGSIEKVSF